MNVDFEDIRPYYDSEIHEAVKRITGNPLFVPISEYLFPEETVEEIKSQVLAVNTSLDFQKVFMHKAIRSIINQTSDGLTIEGFDKIEKDKAYSYIANHRDILLDSAILQILLVEHDIETSEITFGSNLMQEPFVVDAGKVNRMFKVMRGSNPKEMLQFTQRLSEYIRFTIKEKNNSIWIAQRNGRTKNGSDLTQTNVLKMFNVSGKKDFAENFKELNILPLTISYEYEPCDVYKARELYISSFKQYVKQPGEDLKSIIDGITGYKGRIHIAAGNTINNKLDHIAAIEKKADKFNALAKLIDNQIYKNYKLWPTNFLAYDLLNKQNSFSGYYTNEEKEKFINHVNKSIQQIEGDQSKIEKIFLEMYANPVINCYINK